MTESYEATKPVVYLEWTESERGWGKRPDGISLHLRQAEANRYVREYWARERASNPGGEIPESYAYPEGTKARIALVDAELHARIADSAHGIRLWPAEVGKARIAGRIKFSGDI